MKKRTQWILVTISGILLIISFLIKNKRNDNQTDIFNNSKKDYKIVVSDSSASIIKNNKAIKDSGSFDNVGLKNSKWTHYYQNGKKKESGNYVGGKKEGEWKKYYENGKVMESGNYTNDMKDGTWENYGVYGMLYLRENYKKGIENGEATSFHDNGEIFRQGLKNDGKEVGIWSRFSNDGILEYKLFYQGLLEDNAIFKSYYPSGKIKMTGKIINQFEEGDFKEYDKLGNLIFVYTYKKGEIIKEKQIK